MKKLLVGLVLILLLIAGCSQTNLVSFIDPSYNGEKFTRIMILYPITDLQIRNTVEKIMAQKMTTEKLYCIASIEAIPPTRELNGQSIQEAVNTYSLNGILLVSVVDASSKTDYIKTSNAYTSGNASVIGNNIYYNETYYPGSGFNLTSSNLKCELKLIDTNSVKTVWMASSETKSVYGENYAYGLEDTIKSLANMTLNKLVEDKIVEESQNQTKTK